MTVDRHLTTKEAAEFLGYSPRTLQNARNIPNRLLAGRKPPKPVKLGNQIWRYPMSRLEAWINGEKAKQDPP